MGHLLYFLLIFATLLISNSAQAQGKLVYKWGEEKMVNILNETETDITFRLWRDRNRPGSKLFTEGKENIDRIWRKVELRTLRKHQFFISTGMTISGTGRKVRDVMVLHGFDKPSQCWLFCSGATLHPHSNNFPFIIFGYEQLLKSNNGWGVQIGNTNGAKTFGNSNQEGLIKVGHRNFSIIPFYSLYSRAHLFNLRSGVSFNNFKTFRDRGGHFIDVHNNISVGFMLRISGSLSETERSESRFFIEGRLNGNSKIGPYFNYDSSVKYPEDMLNFSHIILGISYSRKY